MISNYSFSHTVNECGIVGRLVSLLVLALIDGSEADGLGCPTTHRMKETVLNVTERDRQCKKQGW